MLVNCLQAAEATGVNDRFWCSAADLVLGRSFSRGVGRGCCVGLVGKSAERAYYG